MILPSFSTVALLISAVSAAASYLTFTNLYQFQPQGKLHGLSHVTDEIRISSTAAENTARVPFVNLEIDMAGKLVATTEAGGLVIVIENSSNDLLIPQSFEDTNDLISRQVSKVRVKPGDMVVAILPHDSSVAVGRNDLLKYFNGINEDTFETALIEFCVKYWKSKLTVVGVQVADSSKRSQLSKSFKTISFQNRRDSNTTPVYKYRRSSNHGYSDQYVPLFVNNNYEDESKPTTITQNVPSPRNARHHNPLFVHDRTEDRRQRSTHARNFDEGYDPLFVPNETEERRPPTPRNDVVIVEEVRRGNNRRVEQHIAPLDRVPSTRSVRDPIETVVYIREEQPNKKPRK